MATCPFWLRTDGECCPDGTHVLECPLRAEVIAQSAHRPGWATPRFARFFVAWLVMVAAVTYVGAAGLGLVGHAADHRPAIVEASK